MSQNSSCPSHFYSHQVLIRAVRSEELSGQQELLRLWSFHIIAANYRLMMTQLELLTTTNNRNLISKSLNLLSRTRPDHKSERTLQIFAPAQTSKKPSFLWKPEVGFERLLLQSLVLDKTTFHYCKSLRIFRQHKFCKLNLIFPDRNTLYRSVPTCITAPSSSRVTAN